LREQYSLEYGEDVLEIQADALRAGQSVVIVDDLLATGGTAAATAALVERSGARVAALVFLVELGGLGARERLAGRELHSLITFPAG
jgi:adenine phosphoribosyltransferase